MVLAYNFPLLDAFWTVLEVFLFIIWIWLAITVYIDIFRSRDLSGVAKALWVLVVVILPYIGVFIYLIVRGGKMHERAARAAQANQAAAETYIRDVAGTGSSVDELSKLADLRDRGVLTAAEFDQAKAKFLARDS